MPEPDLIIKSPECSDQKNRLEKAVATVIQLGIGIATVNYAQC